MVFPVSKPVGDGRTPIGSPPAFSQLLQPRVFPLDTRLSSGHHPTGTIGDSFKIDTDATPLRTCHPDSRRQALSQEALSSRAFFSPSTRTTTTRFVFSLLFSMTFVMTLA